MSLDIGASVSTVAGTLGGVARRGSAWFDGFWDFVVEHRAQLAEAWEIQGADWAVIVFPPLAGSSEGWVHVFVEAKEAPPTRAPWPVSSIALEDGDSVQLAARDRLERPFDAELAAAVRALGYDPLAGYWGIQASRRFDLASSSVTAPLFSDLPQVLDACRRLGLTLG